MNELYDWFVWYMNEIVNGNCVFMIEGCMVHDMRGHGECCMHHGLVENDSL